MPLQQISVSTIDRDKEILCLRQSDNWKILEPVYTTSGLGDPKMERCPSQSSTLSNNNDICRICHCEGDSDAPLIAPCYCAGSLRYVHQACLQQWIKSSDIRCCELCKFMFIMQSKLKPVNQWESLGMSAVERRKLLCSVAFHAVALACVVWSLYILIDRTADEMHRGVLEWPFWTKLVVVAIGFTGGLVFMYMQCKVYLHLCRRWRAFNRVIYVQDAPEKVSLAQAEQTSFAGGPNCCGGGGVVRNDTLHVPGEPCRPPSLPCTAEPRPDAAEAKAFVVDETRRAGGGRDDGDNEECSRLLGPCSSRNVVAPVHGEGGGGGGGGQRPAAEAAMKVGSQSPLLAQRLGDAEAEK